MITSERTIHSVPLILCLLYGMIVIAPDGMLNAQSCEDCVYYDVTHLSRVEGHPDLGSWEELWTLCIPFDEGRDFRVTADGMTASKFEVSLVLFGGCIYERTDPMVVFIDENFEYVSNPTPEEHGIIEVVGMSETTVFFEYTHPTDLPPAGEKFRQVRILIEDYSSDSGEYGGACWMVINIYRPPILLVHGLWSEGSSFEAMADAMTENEYEEQMIVSANYKQSNASSFSTNADVVPTGINLVINQCRDSYMSVGKANLVGHSMGGILSRQYLQTAYRNDVFRLVTCNTPHSGSQAANFLLDPSWSPYNDMICDVLNGITYYCNNGALADLSVGSPAITALNSSGHPSDVGVHALVTTEDWPDISVLSTFYITWSELLSVLVYLSNSCGPQVLDTLYNGDYSDLVVALDSQRGGLSGVQTSIVADQWHVGSTANPAVIDAVKSLLSEPYDSDKFTYGGYDPDTITYNNAIGCDPFIQDKPLIQTRTSSNGLSFGDPQPGEQEWTSGDTAQITVFGPATDTIVLVFKLNEDLLYVDKLPGPVANFQLPIPEDISGTVPLMVFSYSADLLLTDMINDSMVIDPGYSLTGITVFPTKIFSNTGDTTDFQVIGHYDDGIDRLLNGHPDLVFTFTTWSASPTAQDDILLNFALNDTLVVSIDTFESQMVKIYFSPNPAGPVFWLGGTGDWTEDDKWDIGCPPGPANTVYISSGTCTIPSLIHAYAKAVIVTNASVVIDGQLSIEGSTETALHINKSSVENNGVLNISDVSNTAIWLDGISSDSAFLFNYGEINVNTCTGTYGVYIGTHTQYTSGSSGTLSITDCGLFESLQIQSASSGFSVINAGTISIDGGEIGGVGRIQNDGTLSVVHSIPDTYSGLTCSYLLNTPGGIIRLGSTFNAALTMSFGTDSLINEGLLIIDRTNFTGMRVANCVNSGDIEIRNVPQDAIFHEGNNYTFKNLEGGSVYITDAGRGIHLRNTGAVFENSGTIFIDTTNTEGIEVRFNAVFTNDSTGMITIRNSGTQGIYVLDNTSTVFNNSGVIEISSTTEHGIRAHGNGIFHNLEHGKISVTQTGSSGLTTTGTSLHGNTHITNAGEISIMLPIGTWGIHHTKRFTNYPCGVIRTEAPLYSAAANFLNNGFMHLQNTTAHTVTSTVNKFVNDGWIEDYNGLLNLSTQVTNNSVVAAPVGYGGCSGVDITEIFTLGDISGFSVSDGYGDPGLSQLAGFFEAGTNTFTPNSSGILETNWYFSVMDTTATCIDTIQVQAQATCPVNCSGDPYFWTGCADTDWDDPGNWNLGTIPTVTDTVTISGLPAGGVFPEILIPTSVGHLDLRTGAVVTIRSGATLNVEE